MCATHAGTSCTAMSAIDLTVAKLTRSSGRYRLLIGKDHGRFAWLVADMQRYDVS